MKTLYISDLDGTLLDNNAELSDYTIDTLNAMIADGLYFSIATARTLASAEKILAGLTAPLPIILMNGVLIYDTVRQSYIKINALTPETVAAVIKTLRRFDITGFMYALKDGELTTYHESLERPPLRDFVEERIAKYSKTFTHTKGFDCVSPDNVIYFTLLDTYERLKPVHEAIEKLTGMRRAMYEDNYRPGYWYLEIFSGEASKYNAVKQLREMYGFERVIGFGDNLNDLPMFEACDIKVAVENARPEVKTAADYICGANVDDGVAGWIGEREK